MSKRNIYIAGPMSGIFEHNKTEFLKGEAQWKARGYNVFNPISSPMSRLVQEGKLSGQEAYRQCMRLDCEWICTKADAIYMLRGWQRSPGATAEHSLAVCLGLDIYYQDGPVPNPHSSTPPETKETETFLSGPIEKEQ